MNFGISVFFLFSGKFQGIDYAMLPNCEWNQKPKHKNRIKLLKTITNIWVESNFSC